MLAFVHHLIDPKLLVLLPSPSLVYHMPSLQLYLKHLRCCWLLVTQSVVGHSDI